MSRFHGLIMLGIMSICPCARAGSVDYARDIKPIFEKHCYSCHGPEKQKSGLNLSIKAKALAGGDGGLVMEPGSSEKSLLYRMAAGLEADLMPPKKAKEKQLSKKQLGLLRAWLDQGAKWPEGHDLLDEKNKVARKHWSFQPISAPTIPKVKNRRWVRNPIDAFILARLEAEGLEPSPEVAPHTFLRRATFDLTGLPPTIKQIQGFRKNPDVSALIDQLLASPHHGERYGRHWLDVVRFADSGGYEGDYFYNHAASYRDYVIQSINQDKPFDRFVREQLAADELWPNDKALQHAMGIHTLAPWKYPKGVDRRDKSEHDRRTDVADTIGAAFLGLTVACARCHDHKFDPISQRDYFGLHAVIAGAQLYDTKTGSHAYTKGGGGKPAIKNWIIRTADKMPAVHLLRRGDFTDPGPVIEPVLFTELRGPKPLDDAGKNGLKHRSMLAEWLLDEANPLTARVIVNRVWSWHFGTGLVATPNDFGTQGEKPSHPKLLDYLASELVAHDWKLKHLHRLIMTSATYRMTSVTSKTSVASSIITTSKTEKAAKQSAGEMKDPHNQLFWRFPRRHLEAEAIWDNLHATAGTINLKMGGPSVVPPISKQVTSQFRNPNWKVSSAEEWTRRGVYIVVRRSLRYPFFDAFNVNTPSASCGQRDRTVVAPQALHLLNGDIAARQARAFAGRLLKETETRKKDSVQIQNARLVRLAWLYAFAREPDPEELAQSIAFLKQQSKLKNKVDQLPKPIGAPDGVNAGRAGAIVELCLALMNTNEFIYVD